MEAQEPITNPYGIDPHTIARNKQELGQQKAWTDFNDYLMKQGETPWYEQTPSSAFIDFLRCRIDAERGYPQAVDLWTKFCTWKLKNS